MFEKINEKLNEMGNMVQMDIMTIDTLTQHLRAVKEIKEPGKIEYQHHYMIDIRSNCFFLS